MAGSIPRTYQTGDPQRLTVAAGSTVNLTMQAVRPPQESAKPLAGSVVRSAIEVLEPTIAFGVQVSNGQQNLGLLTASLSVDLYDTAAIEPIYTIVRDVTGELLLTRGSVTYSPADFFCFVAKLAITNRGASDVDLQITRRVWGVGNT